MLYPMGPLLAFSLCLIIALGQGYHSVTVSQIDWSGMLAAYLGIPLFALLWLGYKIKHKTRLVAYHQMTFPQRN